MRSIHSAVTFASILLINACGGGGSEPAVTQEPLNGEQPASFSTPNDPNSFQDALYTRYASSSDFDVWQCARSGSTTPEIGYSLPVAGTLGDGLIGREYSLGTGGESSFRWETLGSNALRTTGIETGLVTDTTDYQFSNESSFSFEFTSTGFNCDLVSNTVAFGGEPVVPINNGGSGALEAANARIPASNRPVSAIGVSTFETIFFVSEADMLMTFPNGLRTSCVDWDLVNDQPRDCGSNLDSSDEILALKPFSAGQTIDNTFGLLTASGSSSNQLTLTSSGDISIGAGLFSVYGIDSPSSAFTTGRYYVNGYTITLEFNGTIYHSFIGIENERNGEVATLFLANRYYSENL